MGNDKMPSGRDWPTWDDVRNMSGEEFADVVVGLIQPPPGSACVDTTAAMALMEQYVAADAFLTRIAIHVDFEKRRLKHAGQGKSAAYDNMVGFGSAVRMALEHVDKAYKTASKKMSAIMQEMYMSGRSS